MEGRAGPDGAAVDGPDPEGGLLPQPVAVVRAAEEAGQARASIEQAAGVVMFLLGCTAEQASDALDQVSEAEGVGRLDLAQALLLDAPRRGTDPVTSPVEAVARAHWSGAVQQWRAAQPTRGGASGQ